MVTLEFYDPSGTLEVTQQRAPRLASLEGRRIGFVSTEQWPASRMLPTPTATWAAGRKPA